MAGGPTMNFLLAFVILLGVARRYGVYRTQPVVNGVQECIVAAGAADTDCPASRPLRPRRPGSRRTTGSSPSTANR